MCGIIGYTGKQDAVEVIIEGLRRLEYRGYDSAGIAMADSEGKFTVTRCKGKIRDLDAILSQSRVRSKTAIGHTRWATHGKPSVENAHPHRSGSSVIVHNGIIENYFDLRRELMNEGFNFVSETDTEVMSHLIEKYSEGRPLEEAVSLAAKRVRGAYAIAAMSEKEPGKIVALRKDSPLVVGISEGENFVASDIPAFLSHCRNVVFLEDNEMAILTPEAVTFIDVDGRSLEKEVVAIGWSASMAEKGGYKHFMLKEIYEQPRSLGDTIASRLVHGSSEVNLGEFELDAEALKDIKRVLIVACGTSWHAGLAGKYMIERLARVPVEVDIASEFRYRAPLVSGSDLFVSITQSGETADTLAAQRLAKGSGAHTLNICNVVGSTSSREADSVFYTRSGPEIGVASTKAFTAQMAGLYMLAMAIGRAKGTLTGERMRELAEDLFTLPDRVERTLALNDQIERIGKELSASKAFLFLGRGVNFPIALEGALKLKEISYIHAEGYPAGEMKHGPIALIDEGYPVVFLAPRDVLYEKVISNMQEIKSRGGRIIIITDESNDEAGHLADHVLRVPVASEFTMPTLMAIPLQLMAYHIGVFLGCDVDQPRNLAKSVTVE